MYNSVAELHIGLDLALQQLNSNRKQVVKPEEKDWFLNDTLLQVLNNHIDPNAMLAARESDSDQRVVDYLNPIKTSFKFNPSVFTDVADNLFSVDLPADYYRKSRIRAGVCLERRKVDNGFSVVDNDKQLVAVVPFVNKSIVNLSSYLDQLSITVANRVVFNSAEMLSTDNQVRKYNFTNIRSKASLFMMLPTILEVCNSHKWLSVYWESYQGVTHNSSFIFVVNRDAYFSTYNANIAASPEAIVNAGSYINKSSLTAQTGKIVTGTPTKVIPVRVIESADFDRVNSNVFFDSSYHSLSCVIEGGKIKVKGTNYFGITNIELVYYRRPKLINYATGQNCEITADDFRVQLVNQTAQKINAFLNGETYNQMIKENLMML